MISFFYQFSNNQRENDGKFEPSYQPSEKNFDPFFWTKGKMTENLDQLIQLSKKFLIHFFSNNRLLHLMLWKAEDLHLCLSQRENDGKSEPSCQLFEKFCDPIFFPTIDIFILCDLHFCLSQREIDAKFEPSYQLFEKFCDPFFANFDFFISCSKRMMTFIFVWAKEKMTENLNQVINFSKNFVIQFLPFSISSKGKMTENLNWLISLWKNFWFNFSLMFHFFAAWCKRMMTFIFVSAEGKITENLNQSMCVQNLNFFKYMLSYYEIFT